MRPSENCLKIIRRYESFRNTAYLCPAGKWTYGYGFTAKADGTPVSPGDKITREEAEGLLVQKACELADFILAKLAWKKIVIGQQHLDSLVSFAFNVGTGNLLTSSIFGLVRKGILNDPETIGLFARWRYAGDGSHNGRDDDGDGQIDEPGEKQRLDGLVKRRLTEGYLFATGLLFFDWTQEEINALNVIGR